MKFLFLIIPIFSAFIINAQTLCISPPLTIAAGTGGVTCQALNASITLGGLSTFGTANYLIGMNSAANGFEYKQLLTGTTGSNFNIDISTTAGVITFNLPDAGSSTRGVVNTS